jgi:uncharacterized protein (DUF2461 family)
MTTIPLKIEPRMITVVRTEVERTGTARRGPWTLYRVFATEPNGTPINDVLKTFDALPVGDVRVTQEAFVKDDKIQHYTISLADKKQRTPRTQPHGGDVTEIVELRERVDKLERIVRAIMSAAPELFDRLEST